MCMTTGDRAEMLCLLLRMVHKQGLLECSHGLCCIAAGFHQAIPTVLCNSCMPNAHARLSGPALLRHTAHLPNTPVDETIGSTAHLAQQATSAGASSEPDIGMESTSMPAELPAAMRPAGRAAMVA